MSEIYILKYLFQLYFGYRNFESREILETCRVLTIRVPFYFSTLVPKIDLSSLLMHF